MPETPSIGIYHAIQDFHSARQKAALREIIARFTGDSIELMSFGEVRQKLKAQISAKKELKEIPLDSIIGSVNRYQDFYRDFLPGKNIDEERWANIDLANYGFKGLPPIEVYQIDQAYFVIDGNHRVSVAKQLGASHIQAYVTQVSTRVSFTPDSLPTDLILKSEYADFLEHTNLDKSRPTADLSVSFPGQYPVVEEHIVVHRYFMGIEQQREIPIAEAAADWYDGVYLPIITLIQERGLLTDFPERTELDLYLWIAEHRALLEEDLNTQVEVISALDDLSDQFSQRPYRVIARLGNKIVKTLVPSSLESGPAIGEWRQAVQNANKSERLFGEILVPINGREDGWWALEQAITIARREPSRLHGFYILNSDDEQETIPAEVVESEFFNRCQAAGIQSDFQAKTGDITSNICERARWSDLVIINLSFPPEASLLGRLSSGIRNLVQRCPRPIMFTPQLVTPLNHALLAYDGSLKAQEALFIAAYLAAKWEIPLSVITIGPKSDASEILGDAEKYLEVHNITASYFLADGQNPSEVILQQSTDLKADFLIIGGYSRNPVLEVLQGGDVDQLLRQTHLPVIICR
ncbi:MAG: universal stress protein UspA [Anaerolineales bacterium]|nr:MAG: universal stress protein UspA [Anaerolineales bacterium]